MGSGSLAAMSVYESKFKENMTVSTVCASAHICPWYSKVKCRSVQFARVAMSVYESKFKENMTVSTVCANVFVCQPYKNKVCGCSMLGPV